MNLIQKLLTHTPEGWSTNSLERKSYYAFFIGQNAIYALVTSYLTTYFMLIGVDLTHATGIMLAIKTIIFKYNCIDTIIFDEVDTGVSGKVASSIGEKMKSLSHDKQVICITHLPQVASLAKYHYVIEKNTDDETTVSSVKQLTSDNERIKEIANMLSGEHVSKEAIENAKKLLNV